MNNAFDRVNHFKLFTTLSKRNVPMYIIRILIFWYTSQTMYVRWNNTMSTGFNVSNGVRQGGILSPYLFCIYVDELNKMLNNVHVGCFVGTMLVNHLQMIWYCYRLQLRDYQYYCRYAQHMESSMMSCTTVQKVMFLYFVVNY